MKTKFVLFAMITTTLLTLFTSCGKEEEATKFNYPMETLYGTWNGTEIYLKESAKWVNITQYPYTKFGFSIKFNSNGTYYGSGYFGNGSGTYNAMGNEIITYVDGVEYAKYGIISLSSLTAELIMYVGTSDLRIKVKKQ